MAITDIADERTTHYLTVNFLDKNGDAATPSTISYRVDCLTNASQVRDDTPVSPAAASIEITLDSDDCDIIDQDNSYEERLVTVNATFAADDECHDEFRYLVKNLSKVPSPS